MNNNKIIDLEALFVKGDYKGALREIKLLNDSNIEDDELYTLKGRAYLYSFSYKKAGDCFLKANIINPGNVDALNGLAFLALKKEKIGEAVEIWTRVLDIDKKNIIAKNNLKIFKSNKYKSIILRLDPLDFFPLKNKNYFTRNFYLLISSILIALFIVFLFALNLIKGSAGSNIHKTVSLADLIIPIEKQNISNNLKINPDEAQSYLEKIYIAIKDNRYNYAIYNLNRLDLSEISEDLKQKIKSYRDMPVYPVSAASIDEEYDITQVLNNPALYKDCYIYWTGNIFNIIRHPFFIRFFLKIKSKNNPQDAFVAFVEAPYKISYTENKRVNILAKIIGKLKQNGILVLKAVDIKDN